VTSRPGRRRGASRQREWLHVLHDDAELVVKGAADRLAPASADVQVGAATAAVGHREDLVRAQQPEGDQRNHHPDDDRDQDGGWRVDGQVQAGQATSAIISATRVLPYCRLRPWGTRQYSMLTSRPLSIASGNTG
jgi:hypothetical protein